MKLYYFENPESISDYRDTELLENKKPFKSLTVSLSRYGYRTIVIWAYSNIALKDLSIKIGSVKNKDTGETLGEDACMAISYQGINAGGDFFSKNFDINAGALCPIVFGLDMNGAALGEYTCDITIGSADMKLILEVDDRPVFASEICSSKSIGRVKWLNSKAPLSGRKVAKGYEPITLNDYTFALTGKKVTIASSGLPDNADSYYTPSNYLADTVQNRLFYKPMEFVVEGQKFKYDRPAFETLENVAGIVVDGKSDAFNISTSAIIYYEGRFDYSIKLKATKGVIVPKMSLLTYFKCCKFDVGMGLEGGAFKPIHKWKYSSEKNQDSIFVGDINCGARIKFKSSKYEEPEEGVVYRAKPLVKPCDSWDNYGKGYVTLLPTDKGALLTASTGHIIVPEGAYLEFNFEISFTPFHPLRLSRALNIRPYQPKNQSSGILSGAYDRMCNYINLTCGGDFNPYENDPFSSVEALNYLVSEAHKQDIGVNLQYTPNTISSHASDIKLLNMLGGDVFFKTKTGRLLVARRKFSGAEHAKEGEDAIIACAPGGRMNNYYVEGVNYLISDVGIDGIHLDNLAINRDTADRVRRILDGKSGIPAIIDADVENLFNQDCNYANALNSHTEALPFIDKLSIGKSYNLSNDKDYIITELSGLMYGLMSELPSDEDPIKALVFGMTCRYSGEPKMSKQEKVCYELHRFLDDFGFASSKMYGYWDENNPVTVDGKYVLATTYVNGDRLFVAMYNFGDKKSEFDVGVNPKKGFTSLKKKVFLPAIAGIQNEKKYSLNSLMTLKAHSGIILEIK